jgi:NitT/TauT family transport system substrate-binding protein
MVLLKSLRRPAGAVVASLACVLVSGAAQAADYEVDCKPLQKPVSIKVGTFPGLMMATYHISKGMGYLAAEKITAETVSLGSLADGLTLLARGDIDVTIAAITAPYLSGIDKKLDVRFVATEGVIRQSAPRPTGFYVRTKLLDSGEIKSIADLRGHKVALYGPAGSSGYSLSRVLAEGGLTFKDIILTPLTYPDMVPAMRNGAIDAAYISSPFDKMLVHDKSARLFGKNTQDVGQTIGAILFGPNLLKKNPQVGCAFLRANMRAAREALTGNYNQNDKVVNAFVTEGNYSAQMVRETPTYDFPPDLAFNPATVQSMQQFYMDAKLVRYTKPVPLDQLLAEDLRKAAAKSLDSGK